MHNQALVTVRKARCWLSEGEIFPQRARPEDVMTAFSRVLLCGRLFALCAALWLSAVTSAHALPQGEWVTTGPPIASLATGGILIILADGTPLLFGLDAGRVQQYHPDTGAWTANGSLQTRRSDATV